MDLTSNLTTFGVFISSLVLFHVIFLKVRRLSQRQIKMLDYWWLGFAALGLTTATGQVRQLRSTWEVPLYEGRLESSVRFNRSMIRSSISYADIKGNRNEYSPVNFDEIEMERVVLKNWIERVYEGLPDSTAVDGYDAYRATLAAPKLNDQFLIREALTVLAYIDDIIVPEKKLAKSRAAAERTDFEVVMFFLSPVLFAVALALRITKVTLDLSVSK